MTDAHAKPAQARVSIRDVAERAGVSRQTVVRAMNDQSGINAETKERVRAIARELRYRPSRFGRGLAKQDSSTVGLVVSDLTNAYFAELASEFISVAGRSGWTVLVQEIERDQQHEHRVLSSFANQVDAIVGYLLIDDDELDSLVGGLPVVRFVDLERAGRRPAIAIDYQPGMSAAIDHLISGGRRHILMLDAPNEAGMSPRAKVYSEIYGSRGFEPVVVELPHAHLPTLREIEDAVGSALADHPDTDAIIGFNDVLAIGAMRHLRRAGRAVPSECAVVGIDGLPLGEVVSPTLTTLALDMGQAAQRMFDAMIAAVHTQQSSAGQGEIVRLSHALTVRESSGAARAIG